MELSKTKRDAPKLLYEGCSYVLDKIALDQTQKYWRCEKRDQCRGRMTTNMDCTAINKMPSKHSHPPNPARVAAVKTVAAIRDRASTSEETTSSVINNCTQNLSLAAAAAVPRRDHLARMVRRKRQAQDSKMAATSAKSPGIPNFKMAAVKLSTDVIRAFVDSFDTILVDCDGMFQQLYKFKIFFLIT